MNSQNNQTVESLRKMGTKVRVEHRRRYYDPVNRRCTTMTRYEREHTELPDYVQMDGKGGMTVVSINVDGTEKVGLAECSKKDCYSKKLGVSIALGRALQVE